MPAEEAPPRLRRTRRVVFAIVGILIVAWLPSLVVNRAANAICEMAPEARSRQVSNCDEAIGPYVGVISISSKAGGTLLDSATIGPRPGRVR